jgi:hypothetical protein
MKNLTNKPVVDKIVFVRVGDLIPVKIPEPVVHVMNMLVVAKTTKYLTCDDGSGIERTVIFKRAEEMAFFELIHD